MSHRELHYLDEMGIQCYELIHPQRLDNAPNEQLMLPESCHMLLVSPECPQGKLALLFERVLKTVKLDLSQALHIYPEQYAQLAKPHSGWIWFAGCEAKESEQGSVLVSPMLNQIDGNNEQRRALWQQIQKYQTS
ncbi:DNA polymerase III subunit psi [Vibrio sinaloensis DSM 21326]|uniref:DNA polymerase III subunit psi n=1 Tax=Vibrio sinaloensis DSM 21326 TaxID=945550 RepID=E8M742_PHOS4|nr:DNA polymerase III subunit psi [Vibrio sinaloensis]EGA70114.1 DNA polymerase III subunit psi [Vibrio sinaloensis DSM 21326]